MSEYEPQYQISILTRSKVGRSGERFVGIGESQTNSTKSKDNKICIRTKYKEEREQSGHLDYGRYRPLSIGAHDGLCGSAKGLKGRKAYRELS
jgi:hypothetical protein